MSYQDTASSHFSLGPGSARSHYPTDDRSTYSVDSRNATRSPPNYSSVDVVTPAQAYATAVRKGSPAHGYALHCTIERRQPQQLGSAESQLIPSRLGLPGHGLTLAQRLYASALNNNSSSIPPSSNLPILPPINHASSSTRSMSEGTQASCGIPDRKTSISPSLSSTCPENLQLFNPSDLYHSSVVKRGLQSRDSTSERSGAMRPPSLLPALQVPNSSHPPYQINLRSPYSPLQSATLQPEVPITHPILQPSQDISLDSQSNDIPAVGAHEASGRPGMSIDTRQETHTGPVTGGTTLSPLPLEPQMIPPSFSPPPFEEHDQLSIPSQEIVADIAPAILRPPAAVSHEPPPEDDHEEVPLYTLVDEELPPPSFDDIQAGTSAQGMIEAPTSPSESPPQSPPPFSCGPSAYAVEDAPVYSHLEETSFSVGRSRNTNEDNRIPLSSASTCHPSDRSSSDPLTVVPSVSPSTSPSNAASHDGVVTPLIPPLPSDSRLHSVPSYRLSDGQCVGTSYDSSAIHRSPPPLLNYRTKPTARQSGQSFLPPPALRSGPRPLEASNRRNSRSLVSATEDNIAIDALTRSLSDMMKGPSSATHNFAYENVSSGEQNIHRTSFGNDQNILISPASHPSGTTRITENHETSRTEAERLAREAYLRPTHGETGGRTGHGTQGSGPANLGVLSSPHLPPTVPSTGLIPPAYSHDKFYTESTRTADVLNQFCETPVLSSRTSLYSDRSHIAFTQPSPSPSFPYPLQLSHHPISGNAHGPFAPAESIPPQQHRIHSVQTLDSTKRGYYSFPPLPPLPPPPIGLPSWNASKTPPTCSYSQDGTQDQFNQAPTLTSNDLARKFAHDALRSLG